jgi:hypothetical protein
VFLMELEINMAFCLPPNLCAAIINIVSIVLGIGFVYCFCWASKWETQKRQFCLSHSSVNSNSHHKKMAFTKQPMTFCIVGCKNQQPSSSAYPQWHLRAAFDIAEHTPTPFFSLITWYPDTCKLSGVSPLLLFFVRLLISKFSDTPHVEMLLNSPGFMMLTLPFLS